MHIEYAIIIPGKSSLLLVAHFHILSTHSHLFQCNSNASVEGKVFDSVSTRCLPVFLIVASHVFHLCYCGRVLLVSVHGMLMHAA